MNEVIDNNREMKKKIDGLRKEKKIFEGLQQDLEDQLVKRKEEHKLKTQESKTLVTELKFLQNVPFL